MVDSATVGDELARIRALLTEMVRLQHALLCALEQEQQSDPPCTAADDYGRERSPCDPL